MRFSYVVLCASVGLAGCGYDNDGPAYANTVVASVGLTLSPDAVMTSPHANGDRGGDGCQPVGRALAVADVDVR